jgi:hypothetical protein
MSKAVKTYSIDGPLYEEAKEALLDVRRLLDERITAMHAAVRACEARQDPHAADFMQARHAYIFYRNFVEKAISKLGMYSQK